MPRIRHAARAVGAAAALLVLAACAGGSAPGSGPIAALPGGSAPSRLVHRGSSSAKIQHIVIIVQENRSFNNLFYGFPGATTAKYGYDNHNNKITLQPIGLETTWDIEHDSYAFLTACNGTGSYPGTDCRMNGFDQEWWGCGKSGNPQCPNANPPYSYVPHSETAPYFDMAKQYVLADKMFASNFDESSFISHQYIIAGQAMAAVNYPGGYWGCPGGSGDQIATLNQQRQIGGYEVTCFPDNTIGSEMDGAGLPWAFYTATINGDGGIWSAYQANQYVYTGPDWKSDIITPQTSFFSDVSNGKLRDVSWITPTCANSDHAGCGSNTGPSWVASLVNAIGESKYWDSTAIFILWDDPGGWYEPVKPAMLDYDGLGMRIPMVIVSPYAKKGYVSHTHYEHGSILKFVEDTFGLGRLTASDTRANSPDDAFDFNQTPRKFRHIKAPYDKAYFLHQPLDARPPDNG